MIINKNANVTTPLYDLSAGDARLCITKGNSKVGKGIYTSSTRPGNSENLLTINGPAGKILLTSVPGTCSKHCAGCFNGGCYAVNSARLHHNAVVPAWAANTLLLRSGKFFEEVEAFIAKKNAKYAKTGDLKDASVRTFRINVSGEIQNVSELEGWNKIALKHPEVMFGIYTKNYEALEEFMKKRGESAPNFVINVSQWHGVASGFLAKYPGKFNVFEYDDSQLKSSKLVAEDVARLAKLPHCPAVTASGKHAKNAAGEDITCDHCGRCYRKTGATTAVYAH